MLVKFIYHFPPALLFSCAPTQDGIFTIGWKDKRGEGGSRPRPSEEGNRSPRAERRVWKTSSKGNYVHIWEYVCV